MNLYILFADHEGRATPIKVWDEDTFEIIGGELSKEVLESTLQHEKVHGGDGYLRGYGFCRFELPLSEEEIYQMSVPMKGALSVRPHNWIHNIDPNPVCLFLMVENSDQEYPSLVPFAIRDGETFAIIGEDDRDLWREIVSAANASMIGPDKIAAGAVRCIWFRLPKTEVEMQQIVRPKLRIDNSLVLKPDQYNR